MADLFDNNGNKVGYTDRNGNVVMTRNNGNNGNYNNNNRNNNNNGNNNQPQKKRSGCEFHTSYADKKTGEIIDKDFITAWNFSKSRGMISLIASPHSDPKKRQTQLDHSEVWMCRVKFKNRLEDKWYIGFYNKVTRKLTIPEMEMVANPRAKNGGYFGTYVQKK